MSSLSRREIFLLFIMALIVPTSLIFMLLIAPLQNQIVDKQSELSGLEIQKQQLETNLSIIPGLRTRRETRANEVAKILEKFASPIHASEFERWMLPLFSKYNVRIDSATLSATQVASPTVTMDEVTPYVYELLTLIQEFNNIQNAIPQKIPTTTTQLLFAEYEYNFITSMQNYMNILDEIKSWDTTFVVAKSTFITSDNFASITLQIYSVQKLTPEELLEIYKGDFGVHPNETTGPKSPSNPK